MMNKNTISSHLDIRWKRDCSLDFKQNHELIREYFAGKLQLKQDEHKKAQVERLIEMFHMDPITFYYKFLSCIQVWKIYWYFSPLYRKAQQILVQLAPIKFPYLGKLVINESQIYSIEALAFLDCPHLKEIDIEENFITQLKPLKKTHFPSLIVLKFYYNNFNHDQNQHINRVLWKDFHPLGLYHFWKETFYSISFKMQPKMLKKIYVQRSKGESFNNEKIIQKLQEKFIVQQFFVHFSKS